VRGGGRLVIDSCQFPGCKSLAASHKYHNTRPLYVALSVRRGLHVRTSGAGGSSTKHVCSVCGLKILPLYTLCINMRWKMTFLDERTRKFSGEGSYPPLKTPPPLVCQTSHLLVHPAARILSTPISGALVPWHTAAGCRLVCLSGRGQPLPYAYIPTRPGNFY